MDRNHSSLKKSLIFSPEHYTRHDRGSVEMRADGLMHHRQFFEDVLLYCAIKYRHCIIPLLNYVHRNSMALISRPQSVFYE
jgi:hypothetical protein